jgi:ATP-dependent exoDNAse (exonuclease V) alpha subunit
MHALLGELDRAGGFPARSVLIIDEAGMAGTRLAAAIFTHAEHAQTKIVAVGDPGQLASVHAGGWLGELATRHPAAQLRQVIRQRDPTERDALEALHDGRPEIYLAHKQDATHIHSTEPEAIADLVEQWDLARREHGLTATVMLARDNQTRHQLNHAARQRLIADGTLTDRGVRVAQREFAPGDRIVARRNHPGADIDNGTLATVVAIDQRSHQMTIDTGTRQNRHLNLAYVATTSSMPTR